jgi:hypothetical protein
MCRYGLYGPYKEHFACFRCRKGFKQTSRFELPEQLRPAPGELRTVPCPQCGQPMNDMGHDFKAPRQRDVKQWKKVEILYGHGFTYHSCGCCGPGLRPTDLKDVEKFLAGTLPKSEGELLLQKIERKTRGRESRRKQ